MVSGSWASSAASTWPPQAVRAVSRQASARMNAVILCGLMRCPFSVHQRVLSEERGDLLQHPVICRGGCVKKRIVREAGRRTQRVRQPGG